MKTKNWTKPSHLLWQWERKLISWCGNDAHRSCKVCEAHFLGSSSRGVRESPKQLLCSAPRPHCKPDSIFQPAHQKPALAGSQKGINYTLADSQFWLQTQWVQHKQTLVSIHSREWIKQHQSLSTPLISPLSQLLHFAQNLLTAFIVQFNIWGKNASDFSLSTIPLPQDAQLSFNSLPR